MKVVIAPDSFKESLGAADVAAAMAQGVLDVCPQAAVDLCPLADGGEGTVEAMVRATGGRFVTADVFDPLGGPVRARFGILGQSHPASLPGSVGLCGALAPAAGDALAATDLGQGPGIMDKCDSPPGATGSVAVIEMAAASGLALVPAALRDPRRTTTFGTGQLILAALDAGAAEIIIGLGGSATVDGGCGCAQALGVTFIDREGRLCLCGLAGGGLADIRGIDLSGRDGRLKHVRISVACDVVNPLTGPRGAAAVYGPQKGATPEIVEQLELGLVNLARVIREEVRIDVENLPGAGAAGGLGGGLAAFCGGELKAGFEILSEAVGLQRRLEGADVVLTGEGRLDRSSAFGKTAAGVAGLASARNVPVICIPGQAAQGAPAELFRSVHPLAGANVTVAQAMRQPAELLKRRTAEAMRKFISA